jgi:hypothetical protein
MKVAKPSPISPRGSWLDGALAAYIILRQKKFESQLSAESTMRDDRGEPEHFKCIAAPQHRERCRKVAKVNKQLSKIGLLTARGEKAALNTEFAYLKRRRIGSRLAVRRWSWASRTCSMERSIAPPTTDQSSARRSTRHRGLDHASHQRSDAQ